MGRDPDIGAGVPLASPDEPGNGRRPLASWLARWQAPLFSPLMLLRSGGNDHPMTQLKKAGVDLTQRATIQAVIDQMDRLVAQMESEAAEIR